MILACCGCAHSSSGLPYSVEPPAGSGVHQIFKVAWSGEKGAGSLKSIQVLINGFRDGRQACYVHYDRAANAFLLVNDSGRGFTRMNVGDAGSLANSQCRLSGPGSSVSTAGDKVKMMLDLDFNPTFAGEKQIFFATRDTAGKQMELKSIGSWTVPMPEGR